MIKNTDEFLKKFPQIKCKSFISMTSAIEVGKAEPTSPVDSLI